MTDSDRAGLQRAGTDDRIDREDVPDRTRRALEQYLTVTPDTGRARGADDLVLVTSESGSEYLVDLRAGRCTCEDYEYREADCKHRKRARFATGREPIPADAAAVVDVDPQLGQHTDATLQFAAADGGEIVVAGDEGEVLDEGADADTDDDRPKDCDCGAWSAGDIVDLPCWPCYREGFETPADTESDDA